MVDRIIVGYSEISNVLAYMSIVSLPPSNGSGTGAPSVGIRIVVMELSRKLPDNHILQLRSSTRRRGFTTSE